MRLARPTAWSDIVAAAKNKNADPEVRALIMSRSRRQPPANQTIKDRDGVGRARGRPR
jgi:hypothetical protein